MLARLWCPAAKTFVLCTGWGTSSATQEHSLPAPVPLQRGWDPLPHPEGTGRGHLLLSSLAQGHWEEPLWSCSQRRAGSPCVPELLHGDSSVCLLPLRISLSLSGSSLLDAFQATGLDDTNLAGFTMRAHVGEGLGGCPTVAPLGNGAARAGGCPCLHRDPGASWGRGTQGGEHGARAMPV